MKVLEGKKYIDNKRFDIAEYMKNFSRENQPRDNNPNKSKLTLQDLKNARDKSNRTYIVDKHSDY